jgi:hypothetical protein
MVVFPVGEDSWTGFVRGVFQQSLVDAQFLACCNVAQGMVCPVRVAVAVATQVWLWVVADIWDFTVRGVGEGYKEMADRPRGS